MRIGEHESHPLADAFPLMQGSELDALVESMRTRGFDTNEPIVRIVTLVDGSPPGERDSASSLRRRILDGRNRLRAAERAGIKLSEKHFSDHLLLEDGTAAGLGKLAAYVIGRNIARRHLNESQRAMIAARIVEESGTSRKPGRPKKETPPIGGVSRADAAKQLNVGERSVERAAQVVKTAAPEVVAAVESGALKLDAAAELARRPVDEQRKIIERVAKPTKDGEPREIKASQVRGLVRQVEKAELGKQLEAEPVPLPSGPFRVIVADPAWPYEMRADDPTQRAQIAYPPMPIDEICALDVRSIAHPEGCVLWLWTTNAFMREAFVVLDAWGFEAKTILTWVKDRLGAGHYLRNTTEHCILAVRGKKPVVLGQAHRTDLRGEVREHSRKPETFYELVEAVCPGSKVELFARSPRPGWTPWGAEIGKFPVPRHLRDADERSDSGPAPELEAGAEAGPDPDLDDDARDEARAIGRAARWIGEGSAREVRASIATPDVMFERRSDEHGPWYTRVVDQGSDFPGWGPTRVAALEMAIGRYDAAAAAWHAPAASVDNALCIDCEHPECPAFPDCSGCASCTAAAGEREDGARWCPPDGVRVPTLAECAAAESATLPHPWVIAKHGGKSVVGYAMETTQGPTLRVSSGGRSSWGIHLRDLDMSEARWLTTLEEIREHATPYMLEISGWQGRAPEKRAPSSKKAPKRPAAPAKRAPAKKRGRA